MGPLIKNISSYLFTTTKFQCFSDCKMSRVPMCMDQRESQLIDIQHAPPFHLSAEPFVWLHCLICFSVLYSGSYILRWVSKFTVNAGQSSVEPVQSDTYRWGNLVQNRRCRITQWEHIENGQLEMKIIVGLHSETDYTGFGLDRFYCTWLCKPLSLM